jgi:P pilus assembly chaperone PapD
MLGRKFLAVCALALALTGQARAAGDLLVAPTRIVLEGARGTEVILNNIDSVPATYRISLEIRRMKADGSLEDVAVENVNDTEKRALAMISYAPRKVVLAPNQPQSIRIGVRPSADLPDGEYRVHMLFRAIPESKPVAAPQAASGLSIALTPIYGVTIPVIIRKGSLKAVAAISDPKIVTTNGKSELVLALTRSGNRSTYGRIRVFKPGKAQPVYEVKGIGVYPEVQSRAVYLPIPNELVPLLLGPATVQYVEEPDAGGRVIAEVQAVIR